jgi:hypothetical protein
MKRTPLKRKTPLRSATPLRPRTAKSAGRRSSFEKGSLGGSRRRRVRSFSSAPDAGRSRESARRAPLNGYRQKTEEQKRRRDERFEANGALSLKRPMRYIDEMYLEWIRLQPCILSGKAGHHCYGPIAACHVKTRGSGGGDDQVFPGCVIAHDGQEGKKKHFEMTWKIDLKEMAGWYRAKYERATR